MATSASRTTARFSPAVRTGSIAPSSSVTAKPASGRFASTVTGTSRPPPASRGISPPTVSSTVMRRDTVASSWKRTSSLRRCSHASLAARSAATVRPWPVVPGLLAGVVVMASPWQGGVTAVD